jgi:hypothetical protein
VALVGEAARMRGICPPAPSNEDIADPCGGTDEDYCGCAAVIKNALTRPLRLILSGTK